ncbi:MAG: hypothetical protein SCH39_00155 [Methanosarcinales archaeon]|nr:hypothetical protein [ANME-2 cluster archaeon]MDF1530725.1 hypothetical protein [ANME-2 cluster archaeon]MDW7774733.1 hypothetical protein [Methanosarcinales archaeon]
MELELIVDGKDIPMNRFVEKMIAGVVAGAVQSLDGVNDAWGELTLTIRR